MLQVLNERMYYIPNDLSMWMLLVNLIKDSPQEDVNDIPFNQAFWQEFHFGAKNNPHDLSIGILILAKLHSCSFQILFIVSMLVQFSCGEKNTN
jgi:hypothetical protein